MKRFYILVLFIGLFTQLPQSEAIAQVDSSLSPFEKKHSIEGLMVYPNPTSSDILYIKSKKKLTKTVSIFNVLGNKISFKVLIGNELNISKLKPGVYILKIKEGDEEESMKLIVSSK